MPSGPTASKMATKNCPKCDRANPVACKKCACGHVFFTTRRSANALAVDYGEEISEPTTPQEPEVPRRRTARVTRERPQFYDALQVENQTRRQRELQKRRKASKSDDVDASSEDIAEKPAVVASSKKRAESPPAKSAEPPAKKRRGRPPGLTNRRSARAQILATNKSSDATAKAAEYADNADDNLEAAGNIHDVPAVKALQMNMVLSDINSRISSSSVRAEENLPSKPSKDEEPKANVDSAEVVRKKDPIENQNVDEMDATPIKEEDAKSETVGRHSNEKESKTIITDKIKKEATLLADEASASVVKMEVCEKMDVDDEDTKAEPVNAVEKQEVKTTVTKKEEAITDAPGKEKTKISAAEKEEKKIAAAEEEETKPIATEPEKIKTGDVEKEETKTDDVEKEETKKDDAEKEAKDDDDKSATADENGETKNVDDTENEEIEASKEAEKVDKKTSNDDEKNNIESTDDAAKTGNAAGKEDLTTDNIPDDESIKTSGVTEKEETVDDTASPAKEAAVEKTSPKKGEEPGKEEGKLDGADSENIAPTPDDKVKDDGDVKSESSDMKSEAAKPISSDMKLETPEEVAS